MYIKRMKEYHKLYDYRFDSLDEIDKFLKSYNSSELPQEQTENLGGLYPLKKLSQ